MTYDLFTRNSRLDALLAYLLLFVCSGALWLSAQPAPVHATNTSENIPLLSVAFLGGPPVAQDDTATTPEDTGLIITVLSNDSDPENETLSIAQIGAAQHGPL